MRKKIEMAASTVVELLKLFACNNIEVFNLIFLWNLIVVEKKLQIQPLWQ